MKKDIPSERLQGKFYTENYSRIQCSKCQKNLAILIPGKAFDGIPECECSKVTLPPKKPARKKPAPIEKEG
jgi:hypothetical protein